MALYFSKKKPKHELRVHAISNYRLAIPPGDPEYRVSAELLLPHDIKVYGVAPHMHFRGKSARLTVGYPDGKQNVILSVPNYRFDWQQIYRLSQPLTLRANTRLIFDGAFDNSSQNSQNPDPSKLVRYGVQSTDEMYKCYFTYVKLEDGQ